MSERRFLKPSWGQRHIGNRLAPLFRRDLISKLSVRGRRSGRWHTTPVAVLEHGGECYLISYRGASDWALNLEASPLGPSREARPRRGDHGRGGSGRAARAAACRLHRAFRQHADRGRRPARTAGSR